MHVYSNIYYSDLSFLSVFVKRIGGVKTSKLKTADDERNVI